MTQQISITRALAEIKSLSGRIDTAINEGIFVAVTKGKADRRTVHNSAKPVAAVENDIKASFQKVTQLIVRRQTIKAAVILSNAATQVCINGVSMSVAEAIERKASIDIHTTLYTKLRNQYAAASTQVITGNEKLSQQIEAAVVAAYGTDSKSKPSEEAYAGVAEPRRKDHELSLLDPENIAGIIDSQAAYINGFNTEVDYVLSESNARTLITVE